jgi:hypothetical protein
MRVICPYRPAVHRLTRPPLERYAPHAEFFGLSEHQDAYWRLLDTLWTQAESFILVEHDVEIHERAIRSLTYCPRPWCLFPYSGPRSDGGDSLFYMALGCTRFRSSLMVDHPDLISGIGTGQPPRFDIATFRNWRGLDGAIGGRLRERGEKPHIHWPEVLHHHDYPKGCACGTDCEARP